MAIMSRIVRLWKADLHGVMDQLEDKGLLLKQYLREMENSLREKESRLGRMTRDCRHIRGDLSARREEIEKLEKDLELAVRKVKDDIARMLIRKRRTQQAACGHLQRQLELLEEEKQRLAEQLSQQKIRYDELKVKAAAFRQQAERQQINDLTEAVGATAGFQTPTEEEIELELLQRKEAMGQGGAQ